jgi:MFS family permease
MSDPNISWLETPPPNVFSNVFSDSFVWSMARPWILLAICGLLHGLATFLPRVGTTGTIAAELGSNAFLFNGSVDAAKAALSLILQPAVGVMSDAHGRKPLLAFCLVMAALPNLALLCGSIHVWSTLTVLVGPPGHAMHGLLIASVAESIRPEHRAGAIGITHALMYGFANTIGTVAGSSLFTSFGRFSFAAPLIIAAVNLLYLWALVPETLPKERTGGSHFLWAEMNPCRAFVLLAPGADTPYVMLRVLCACQFTVFCGFIGYMASLSLFLMSAFDLSAQETTPILAFSGICSFIGMSGIGLVRRCGMDEIAIASVGLGMFVLAFSLAAVAPAVPYFYAVSVLIGLGVTAPSAVASLVSSIASPSQQGAVQTLLGAFVTLAEGIGPLFFGIALTSSANTAMPGLPFTASTFGCLIAMGILQASSRFRSPSKVHVGRAVKPLLV